MGQSSHLLCNRTVCLSLVSRILLKRGPFSAGDPHHDDETHAQDDPFDGESAAPSSSTASHVDGPPDSWTVNDPLAAAGVVLAKTPCMSIHISYTRILLSLTLNNPEKEYPTSVHELAVHLGQPNLHELIRWFLYWQLNQDDNNTDIPLPSCPEFDLDISVFHSATSTFHSPSNPSGLRGMHREVIRSTPRWRNKEPRHDCVFVESDTKGQGMQGLDVVRVLAFFSFVADGVYYPSALVQ